MSFPTRRLRRLRISEKMRELVQETRLSSRDFICPIFIQEGLKTRQKIESMPGIERLPVDEVVDEVGTISDLNIPAVMIFGLPSKKDDVGSSSFDENGIVQKTISEIRKNYGEKMVIMADVCLCQYTLAGHCGLVKDKKIDNDSSIETLTKIALSQAKAGVDVVSPSAMMDGQVFAIRLGLDDAGYSDVLIMSHSAKHYSSFYSPFRDAAECAPKFGDRKSYQVPYTNPREAIREIEADIKEGTDIVMIKPALAYLDVIAETKRRFNVPLSAYSVSGEYALVKAAANQGWIQENDVALEILYAIKRAGADMMVTYFAKSAAKMLENL
ncbi:MAG: porphobilinogen synthase [Thaumarchaeota archaeon]|nr:porphobilinogen synthase [Nitrososphaerota archaeon]